MHTTTKQKGDNQALKKDSASPSLAGVKSAIKKTYSIEKKNKKRKDVVLFLIF